MGSASRRLCQRGGEASSRTTATPCDPHCEPCGCHRADRSSSTAGKWASGGLLQPAGKRWNCHCSHRFFRRGSAQQRASTAQADLARHMIMAFFAMRDGTACSLIRDL